jgi:hypothetical protein
MFLSNCLNSSSRLFMHNKKFLTHYSTNFLLIKCKELILGSLDNTFKKCRTLQLFTHCRSSTKHKLFISLLIFIHVILVNQSGTDRNALSDIVFTNIIYQQFNFICDLFLLVYHWHKVYFTLIVCYFA